MTTAIIYTRYSPQRNGENSASCEIQEAYCEQHAAQSGYRIGGVFADAMVSGKEEDRPNLWRAIDLLGKGGVLLVWKRDRLARNVYLSECIKRAVESVDARIEAVEGDVDGDGPEQVMIRQVLDSISEYERKIIGLRTKYAMQHHQREGMRMGRFAPFGYAINPNNETRLIPVGVEQKAIARIMELRDEGRDILGIVRGMNKTDEHKTRTGRAWVRVNIERVLSNLGGD